jgi:hypothetical protein
MIMNPATLIRTALLCVLSTSWAAAEPLKPVVLSIKGSAEQSGKNLVVNHPIEMGIPVSTGARGFTKIALAPGLGLGLGSKTSAIVHTAQGGKSQSFSDVELIKGQVYCSLKAEAKGKSRYRVNMGDGDSSQAVGTMWTAERDGGRKAVCVATGEVTWKSATGKEIKLKAGSVLLAEYETVNGEKRLVSLVVVNLVDGTATTYPVEGGDPVTGPATKEQLKDARAELEEALDGFYDDLTEEERATLLALLSDVNETLLAGGLSRISSPGGGVGGGGGGGSGPPGPPGPPGNPGRGPNVSPTNP